VRDSRVPVEGFVATMVPFDTEAILTTADDPPMLIAVVVLPRLIVPPVLPTVTVVLAFPRVIVELFTVNAVVDAVLPMVNAVIFRVPKLMVLVASSTVREVPPPLFVTRRRLPPLNPVMSNGLTVPVMPELVIALKAAPAEASLCTIALLVAVEAYWSCVKTPPLVVARTLVACVSEGKDIPFVVSILMYSEAAPFDAFAKMLTAWELLPVIERSELAVPLTPVSVATVAAKFPLPSLATMALLVLDDVAVVALLDTFPAVEIVLSLESGTESATRASPLTLLPYANAKLTFGIVLRDISSNCQRA
jgi:hypothetical protein